MHKGFDLIVSIMATFQKLIIVNVSIGLRNYKSCLKITSRCKDPEV